MQREVVQAARALRVLLRRAADRLRLERRRPALAARGVAHQPQARRCARATSASPFGRNARLNGCARPRTTTDTLMPCCSAVSNVYGVSRPSRAVARDPAAVARALRPPAPAIPLGPTPRNAASSSLEHRHAPRPSEFESSASIASRAAVAKRPAGGTRPGLIKMRHGHRPGTSGPSSARPARTTAPTRARCSSRRSCATASAWRPRSRATRPTRRRPASSARRSRAISSASTTPIGCCYPLKRIGPKGRGTLRARELGRGARRTSRHASQRIAAVDPQRIVPYSYAGTMGLVQGEAMAQRFFHRLGASFLDRTICAQAGAEALNYTLGSRIGTDVEQFQNAKLIVFWGTNAIASNLHLWSRAQEAKRRGAKLIAIDPYRSLTAEKCHEHIALLPGTDAALALGLVHVLERERLARRGLHRALHARRRRAARARARASRRARVAEICGITRRASREPRARLRADAAGRDPPELRHAARPRRRQRRARDRVLAGARRALARRGRRLVAVVRAASSTRTARRCTGPSCSPGASRARST